MKLVYSQDKVIPGPTIGPREFFLRGDFLKGKKKRPKLFVTKVVGKKNNSGAFIFKPLMLEKDIFEPPHWILKLPSFEGKQASFLRAQVLFSYTRNKRPIFRWVVRPRNEIPT